MNFDYTNKVKDMRARLLAFMDEARCDEFEAVLR